MMKRFVLDPVGLMRISRTLFRAGIILSAIIMPLEIVPGWVLSIFSILFTLLLVQYPVARWVVGAKSPAIPRRNSVLLLLAIGLPFVALLISAINGPVSDASMHLLRTSFFFVLRAWIIGRYAEPTDLRLFERSVIVVAALVVGFGYFQYLGDLMVLPANVTLLIQHYSSHGTYFFPRIHSLAHEPLYLANYLMLPMALLVWRVLYRAKPSKQTTLLFVATLALFLTTNARGAIAGLILAIVGGVIFTKPARRRVLHLGLLGAASLIVATCLIGVAGIIHGQDTLGSFSRHAIDVNDSSFTSRSHTWPMAIEIFRAHPILGIGPTNSRHYIVGQTDFSLPTTNLPVFNNSFLTLLAEQGLLGVLSLIPLIYIVTILIWKRKNLLRDRYSFVAVVTIVAIAIQANTFEISEISRTWILIGFILAAYRASITSESNKAAPEATEG